MIGKITKGNGFTGACSYLLDNTEARLIGGNMASTTPRQLAAEFRVFSQKNIRVQLPVEHISLSPSLLDRELDEGSYGLYIHPGTLAIESRRLPSNYREPLFSFHKQGKRWIGVVPLRLEYA